MTSTASASAKKIGIFAGGCFWCVEPAFKMMDGVSLTSVGYTGGPETSKNPTYNQICSGKTGFAEAVKVEYDPSQVSFDKLCRVFFKVHDPTTLNRQGHDSGTQYRSAIFFTDDEQKKIAQAEKEAAGDIYEDPIVTEISPATAWWPGETYHQQYVDKYLESDNKSSFNQGYVCQVVLPKLKKIKKIVKQTK